MLPTAAHALSDEQVATLTVRGLPYEKMSRIHSSLPFYTLPFAKLQVRIPIRLAENGSAERAGAEWPFIGL